MLPFLKSDAEKGAARADAAKQQVRAAKAALKRARKLFKAAKKSAKQARKKLEAAAAATRRARKPSRRRPARLGKPAVKAPVVKAPAVKAAKKASISRKRRRVPKVRVPAAADYLRSASDVAKSVIERLRSAPPTLPPAPVIPADPDIPNQSPEVKPD